MHTLWHYAPTDMDNSRKALTTGVDVVGLAQDVLSLCRARSIIISSSPSYLLAHLRSTYYTLAWNPAYFNFLLLTPYVLLLLYIPIVLLWHPNR